MGSKSLRWWHNPGLQVQVLPLVLPSPLPPLHLTSSSKEKWHPSYRNVVSPGSAGWGRLGNRERQRGSFLVGSSLIKPRTTIKGLWLSWGWNPAISKHAPLPLVILTVAGLQSRAPPIPHKETEPTAKGQHLAVQWLKIRIRLRLLKYPIFKLLHLDSFCTSKFCYIITSVGLESSESLNHFVYRFIQNHWLISNKNYCCIPIRILTVLNSIRNLKWVFQKSKVQIREHSNR